METTIAGLVLTILFVLIAGGFALARSALMNSHRSRIKALADEGARGAKYAENVVEESSRLLVTVQFGQMASSLFAAAIAAVMLAPPVAGWFEAAGWSEGVNMTLALILITGVVAFLLLLFGDQLPEALARRSPERIALALAWLIQLFGFVFSPVVRLIMRVSHNIAGPGGNDQGLALVTEQEIKTLVDAGQEEGVIEEDEKAMIYSIFEFGETSAREVMIPRIDMVALEIDTPLEEALAVIVKAGHSRIPVYKNNVDNVQGFLYAKDFLELFLHRDDSPRAQIDKLHLEPLLRPAYFVPESKMLDDLLEELQMRKVHISVVVDEYGGTAGIVTIEDILEEIVGEIQDEYDSEEAAYRVTVDNEYVFNARIDLDDVNSLLGSNFPTEQGETLGGFVYSELGKVPSPGEVVQYDGFTIQVVSVVDRRIREVLVRRTGKETDYEDMS
ncbi:MAG: hemolysin family protein [Chloroflexota bacterium]